MHISLYGLHTNQKGIMAKQGMKRYKPGDGMDSNKKYGKNDVRPVPELQGKPKESGKKTKSQS